MAAWEYSHVNEKQKPGLCKSPEALLAGASVISTKWVFGVPRPSCVITSLDSQNNLKT